MTDKKITDRKIVTVDAVAGAEMVYTADEDMIIHSCVVTLVTSATVANRGPRLRADDGTNIFYTSAVNGSLTASTTTIVGGFEGAPNLTPINGVSHFPMPARGLRLKAGDRLFTDTLNRDAGDNYSSMILDAERL